MKVLLDEAQISEAVTRLAGEIEKHYDGKPITLVSVLTGSLVLVADLIRKLKMPLRVGLVQARSYRGKATRPTGLVINSDLFPEIRGRHVLLVDDIFDTGRTLSELISQVDDLMPASVRSAVLLQKQGRQLVALRPNHVGFEIPDRFVVGYGLDYDDLYRNLPYIAALEDEDLHPAIAPGQAAP